MKSAAFRVVCTTGLVTAGLALAALSCSLAGCGGGGSGGNGGGGGGGGNPVPDFSLSVSPTSLTVTGGATGVITASVGATNGFASNVTLAISGLPAGVTISPATPQVTPGTPLQITFNAATTVAASTVNLTVTGTSGSLSHSTAISLTLLAAPPLSLSRTHYIRTDSVTEYPFWLNENWVVFNSSTRRFFVTDPSGNQVIVLDASKQTEIATIPVPGAFGIDVTPDNTTIYVATQVGDVYAIDPVAMKVTHRYIAAQIGPYGFQAYSVRVLANGKLALLGGQGGYPGVDGYGSIGIWNPSDNSMVTYGAGNEGTTLTNCVGNIGDFTLTGDRSLIVEASIDSDGTICTVNPTNGQMNRISNSTGNFVWTITPSPDGNLLVLPSYSAGSVAVYNARTLTQISTFPVAGSTASDASMVVSADSKTLYIAGDGALYAYDIASGKLTGWSPNLVVTPTSGGSVLGSLYGPQLQAIDGTGLIAGPMEQGIGFLDTAAMHAAPVGTLFLNAYVNPATGPVAGGTQIMWNGSSSGALSQVYLGKNQASNIGSAGGQFGATTPAGTPGPADVYTLMKDGGEQFVSEGYSYGPTILEATPDSSTSDGGGIGILYGYGFGSTANNATIPTNLQVTVGGKPATLVGYTGNAYGQLSPPFNLEAVGYTIPAGTAGSSVDIVVTAPSGSATLAGGMHYLPPVQRFPLPGAVLAQGVYDPRRNVYYFTDAAKIQVFSRNEGQWLTPIAVPPAPAGTTHRLWGIALSPDGSKLAISDASASMIYVLNPDSPAGVQSFPIPGPWFVGGVIKTTGITTYPAGLAIGNAGTIYFAAFTVGGDGYDAFFKLDTNSGVITDYRVTGFGNEQYRVALSSDGARAYFNNQGSVFTVDTATGVIYYTNIDPGCCYGDFDLNLSSNQTRFEATSYLYDADLNAESYLTMNDREALNAEYVYGAKLSPDGSLLFQPSVAGIDVFDGRLGTLRGRIALPFALAQNFDALVSDSTDNVLVALLDTNGDGVAVVDLTSLKEPAPLPYAGEIATGSNVSHGRLRESRRSVTPASTERTSSRSASARFVSTSPASSVAHIPYTLIEHSVNPLLPKMKHTR